MKKIFGLLLENPNRLYLFNVMYVCFKEKWEQNAEDIRGMLGMV